MFNATKAYLKTEGSLTYRDCKISYYTYSIENIPNKFRVNVNLELHYTQNNYTKTLVIDDVFDQDQSAISFGIEQGKKMIDHYYDLGKISIIKNDTSSNVKDNKAVKTSKTKDQKTKTDKR